jgi:hypothetical protein
VPGWASGGGDPFSSSALARAADFCLGQVAITAR